MPLFYRFQDVFRQKKYRHITNARIFDRSPLLYRPTDGLYRLHVQG